jgi:flagellar biosynthesis protein FlhA
VVDASTVVATHLNQVLLEHIDELIGHEEVEQLLQKLAKMSPKLAEELVPGTLTINQLLGVLKNLLSEGVPIRDIRSIAEAIAAQAVRSKDPAALSAAARVALGRTIFQQISGNAASLPVITLEPQMEQVLMKSLQRGGAAGAESEDIVLEPGLAERLQRSMNEAAQRQEVQGKAPVLLVPAPLRAVLARFMRHTNRATKVISYQEVPGNKQVTIEATVG